MINVNDIGKAKEYTEYIIEQLKIWRERYHIADDKDFKINDKDLETVYKKVFNVIKKIIENKNDYILTKDYMYYLSYKSLRMVDYSKELVRLLKNLINIDDNKLIELYKRYFSDIMYDKYLKDVDPIDQYIDRMDGDYKDAFKEYKANADSLSNIFIRGYEFEAMDYLSTIIFSNCAKTNNLHLYKDLSKKYFNDPRHTIDYLYMNGFIKQNYDLIDDFNEFVYNDMNQCNNTKNVIR